MPTDSTLQVFLLLIVVMRGLKKIYLVLRRREGLFCWVSSMPRLVDLYK